MPVKTKTAEPAMTEAEEIVEAAFSLAPSEDSANGEVTEVSMQPERSKREAKSPKFKPDKLGSLTTYRWLDILDEAYKHGFIGFSDSHVQPETTINREGKAHTTWLGSATATFREADGSVSHHSACGEANYENCNKQIGNAAARMAETRAKSRALAHAMNLDANVDFEMEDPNNPGASAIRNTGNGHVTRSVSSSSTQANYQQSNTGNWPVQNAPGAWVCEDCGTELKTTEGKDGRSFEAGQKAYLSTRDTGKILCYQHHTAAKERAAQG